MAPPASTGDVSWSCDLSSLSLPSPGGKNDGKAHGVGGEMYWMKMACVFQKNMKGNNNNYHEYRTVLKMKIEILNLDSFRWCVWDLLKVQNDTTSALAVVFLPRHCWAKPHLKQRSIRDPWRYTSLASDCVQVTPKSPSTNKLSKTLSV